MRYFLIDKVTALAPGVSATGLKCVTLRDPVLHDHFPDYPVMPGALIVEGASQLAGFLLETTLNTADAAPRRALLMQIKDARFHATAGPGDRLVVTVTIDSLLEAAARVGFTVSVDGERIARGLLTFTMRALDSERVHAQQRALYRLWTRDLPNPPTLL